MENASKALIIAGAILLLSILIIGLGMGVYNNSTSSTKNANLDSTEISAHNSQFLAYEGKIKGDRVRSLINLIKQNNKQYEDRMVVIQFDTASQNSKVNPSSIPTADAGDTQDPVGDDSAYRSLLDQVKNNSTYFVTFNERDDGLIGGVDIHLYSANDL